MSSIGNERDSGRLLSLEQYESLCELGKSGNGLKKLKKPQTDSGITYCKPKLSCSSKTSLLSEQDSTVHAPSEPDEQLIPYVYSLKSDKVMCGSAPSMDVQLPIGVKLDDQRTTEMDDLGKQVIDPETIQLERYPVRKHLPKTLWPLAEWASEQCCPENWGICFCPSLNSSCYDDLPIVPSPQSPTDPLPATNIIPAPRIVKSTKVKKLQVSESKVDAPRMRKRKSSICVFTTQGRLLHRSYTGTRTQNVVRKEIEELERLMQGLGTEGSSCIVVQYQTHINNIKRMSKSIIAEVEQRQPKKPETPRSDHFGLRKFYRDHDQVLSKIKKQHRSCLKELSRFEKELGLKEKHFADRDFEATNTT